MSASPVFSSAALGRPFIFSAHPRGVGSNKLNEPRRDDPVFTTPRSRAVLLARFGALPKSAAVTPASRLDVRSAPETVSTGIRELDALTGGLPRGCLTEICGPASSGRTSILLSALARATQRGEVCALVDASDAFDPASAAAAGVEMAHLLWIRCGKKDSPQRHKGTKKSGDELSRRTENTVRTREGRGGEQHISESRLEQVLKVTDLLLQSNGFGMIVLDLGDIPLCSARRIPLASWFRFRRAVEHTPTVLLVLEQQPIAGSCSSLLLQVSRAKCRESGKKHSAFSTQHSANQPVHAQLLDEFEISVELLRSRLERKPVQSATASFCSRAAWAG